MDARELVGYDANCYTEFPIEATRGQAAPEAYNALRAVLDVCDNSVNGMVAESSIRAVIEQSLSR